MPQQPGPAATAVLVVVLGVTTGGLTWATQAVTCSMAPGVPFLNAGCGMDAGWLSVVIGAGAAAVGLVGLLIARRQSRRPNDDT